MPRYFFDSTRKTILALAEEFTDIKIHRQARDGSEAKILPVELIFANKDKFYKRLMKGSRSTQITLPAMALTLESMDYDVNRQKNPLGYSKELSGLNNTTLKALGAPSPFIFQFVLRAKAKYYSDLLQIMETIIPMFQPKRVKKINIVPELGITANINIMLDSVSPNLETETDESAEAIRGLECDFNFRVESFIFPPAEIQDIAMTIKGDGFEITSDRSPVDIVNNRLLSVNGTTEGIFRIDTLETKPSAVYKLNATDIIAQHGEFFSVKDTVGDCSFVFEYDNGECYGKDFVVPEHLSINKTGWIFVRCNHDIAMLDELPAQWKISFWTRKIRNIAMAEDVFHQYADFNARTLRGLRIEKRREIDVVYADAGFLYLASPGGDDDFRCFFGVDYEDFEEARVAFEFPLLDEPEWLVVAGVMDSEGAEIVIQTDGENYRVYEQGTLLDEFPEDARTIVFHDGEIVIGDHTVVIDSGFYRFWVGTNSINIMKYDYMIGY